MNVIFENVTGKKKGFVLKDISFEVQDGFLTGIVGKNGAGKTTLFHYLVDEDAKYDGNIWIDGMLLSENQSALMNRIGFVSEEQQFFMEKTAMENVDILSVMYDEFSKDVFKAAMKKMELATSKMVGDMSRGEFLKFQMAFAMAHQTKLYLLDEVTAGMDPVFRKDFFKILHGILTQEDVAVLMSTHIQDEIEIQMDYVGRMEEGRLVTFEEMGTR